MGEWVDPDALPAPGPGQEVYVVYYSTPARTTEVGVRAGSHDQACDSWHINWGTPNLGGGLVTDGGVFFIGATMDRQFRAFDVQRAHDFVTRPIAVAQELDLRLQSWRTVFAHVKFSFRWRVTVPRMFNFNGVLASGLPFQNLPLET